MKTNKLKAINSLSKKTHKVASTASYLLGASAIALGIAAFRTLGPNHILTSKETFVLGLFMGPLLISSGTTAVSGITEFISSCVLNRKKDIVANNQTMA
jgi:hypothetical protein